MVEFVTPAGHTPTEANLGADATDSDAAAGGRTTVISLSAVQHLRTVDAGFVPDVVGTCDLPTTLLTPAHDGHSGTSAGDHVDGLAGHNSINGLGGDDIVVGNQGDDTVFGGSGNDTVPDHEGQDVIGGGTDNGRVSLIGGKVSGLVLGDAVFGDGVDWLRDFNPLTGDVVL